MSKAVLYANNSSEQTLSQAGTVVNFGNIVRKYGQNIKMSGGNAVTQGQGYYNIDTNFAILPSASATISVAIYSNGTLITGTKTSVTATENQQFALTIPCIDRNACCLEKTITAVIQGSGTIENASILVEKK